jgi:hypothetical protein
MERDSCIRIGSQWIPYGQAEWPGGPRFGSGSVVFKGALWLLGGSGSAYARQFSTTLSESSNGDLCVAPEPEDSCANGPTDAAGKPLSDVPGKTSLDWKVASPDASTPWQARCFMGVLAYKDRLYVIGGARSKCQEDYTGRSSCELTATFGDIWQSAGVANIEQVGPSTSGLTLVSWSKVTSSAAFGTRARSGVIVFQDLMWLMGGQSITESSSAIASRMYNDVWSSSNGESWTQVSVNANWSPRCGHSVAIFLSSMYVIGGSDVSRYYSDVWSSTNGILWTMVVETAQQPVSNGVMASAWAGRWMHASVSFRENLWVLGGHSCTSPASSSQLPEAYVCSQTNNNPGTFYNDVWYSEGTCHVKFYVVASYLG